MVNSVVLVGRAGRDPEMRYFESGRVKTSFSVAADLSDLRPLETILRRFRMAETPRRLGLREPGLLPASSI